MDRHEIEHLPPRAAFELTIEAAEADGDRRIIRGVANTFGVMRSRRIILPKAVEDWLAARPGATVPLLAQHGLLPGFATIGRVERLSAARGKGLQFEAVLAQGIELADQAWKLVQQKLLAGVSLGWIGKQARWVNADDHDLDPWLAQQMKRSGVKEVYAFFDVEVVEVSLVDVGDDPGALLAANRLDELFHRTLKEHLGQAADGPLGALRADVDKLRGELAELKRAGGPAGAALGEQLAACMNDWLQAFTDAAVEALYSSPEVRAAARDWLATVAESPGAAGRDDQGVADPVDRLRARLARKGAGE